MLDDVNLTELVLLAQDTNPNAHRGLGRDLLEEIALGKEIELPVTKLNNTRLTIMGFILEHWTQVKPLLSCPAKTQDPEACFQCTDIQVIECITANDLIMKWRKK
jgi:hypothetical protein